MNPESTGKRHGVGRIEDYSFGRIVLDGEEFAADIILLPGRTLPGWRRIHGHALVLEDLREVLDELPERLIVGTGADGRMRPDHSMIDALAARGVEVEAMPTAEAVRRFDRLDPERTAAALHLTC
jgi:hypothetical protein